MVRLYCFLRLNLKTRILSPRPCAVMVPRTRAAFTASPYRKASVVRHSQHAVEFHLRADIAGERIHFNRLARRDAILFPAGFNHCVHK